MNFKRGRTMLMLLRKPVEAQQGVSSSRDSQEFDAMWPVSQNLQHIENKIGEHHTSTRVTRCRSSKLGHLGSSGHLGHNYAYAQH